MMCGPMNVRYSTPTENCELCHRDGISGLWGKTLLHRGPTKFH